LLVQLAVGDFPVLGRIVAFPDDRDLITALCQVTIQAIVGDVQGAVGEPFDVDMVIVEGGLLDLVVGLIQSMRLPCSRQKPSGLTTDCWYMAL